jgi:hypothetical protein
MEKIVFCAWTNAGFDEGARERGPLTADHWTDERQSAQFQTRQDRTKVNGPWPWAKVLAPKEIIELDTCPALYLTFSCKINGFIFFLCW